MRDALLALLESPDWGGIAALVVAEGADAVASALVDVGTAAALSAAHQLARSDDDDVRRAGVQSLVGFRTSAAQEHLFDILVTTPDPDSRAAALARLQEEPPAGISWMCLESPGRPDYDAGAEEGLVALLADAVGVPLVRDQVIEAVRNHGNRLGARALARARPTTSRDLGLELVKAEPLQRECAVLLLSAEPGNRDSIFALRELARDGESSVGHTAGRILLEVDPHAIEWARKIVGSLAGRLPGLRVLGAHGSHEDLPTLAALMAEPNLRSELVPLLSGFDTEAVRACARALATGAPTDRLAAASMLGHVAAASDIPTLEHLSLDAETSVREAAFLALSQVDRAAARARAHDFVAGGQLVLAVELLAERSDSVAHDALCDLAWSPQLAWGLVTGALAGFSTPRAEAIKALCVLMGAPAAEVMAQVQEALAGPLAQAAAKELAAALAEGSDSSRHAALVRAVGTVPGAVFVDALVDFYERQAKGPWAAEILGIFGPRAHPRALPEVLVALGDRDDMVRNKAEWILGSDPPAGRTAEFWQEFLGTWKRLREWTELASWDFLGGGTWLKPVKEGVGLTWFSHADDGAADVEVTLQPLIDGRPEAWDVIRGVIIHEFGHHTYDFRRPGFKSANGNADAAGVKPIFDLLLDERLERNLRSHDPFYGKLIDRANAYFREGPPIHVTTDELVACVGEDNVRAWVERTGVDLSAGAVDISAWEAALIPGLMPRLDAFYVGLLVVRNPSRFADPAVREALELIPSNLKDLSHADLARLSVAVGDLLDVRDNGAAARKQRRRAARGRLGRHVEGALGKAGAATGSGVAKPANHGASAKASVAAAAALRAKMAKARAPARRGGLKDKAVGGQGRNTTGDVDFAELRYEVVLDPDQDGFRKLVHENRRHVATLRRHFELLGAREVELRAQPRGRRLDVGQVRRLVTRPTVNLLVRHDDDVGANAYIGLLIDRSGSMYGEKLQLARRFAALLAEAAGGVRGLSGHVSAFDDDTFYRLGDFRRNAIGRLESGGGNNDAAGLLRAAQLALQSGRDNRLLVMISDGSPTECSVAALANLVQFLSRKKNIACAQVCVDKVVDRVFPVTLDVRQLGVDAAVHEFGRLLVQLTRRWR